MGFRCLAEQFVCADKNGGFLFLLALRTYVFDRSHVSDVITHVDSRTASIHLGIFFIIVHLFVFKALYKYCLLRVQSVFCLGEYF